MTREEANYYLKSSGFSDEQIDTIAKAYSEPCDDVISRQAVNDAINDVLVKYIPILYGSCEKIPLELITAIMQLPPVNPQEPKTGHWSRKTKVDAYDIAGVKTWGIKCQCDRCNFKTIVIENFGYYNYCPNCGARMESEEV